MPVVVVLLTLVGLAVVTVALMRDEPMTPRGAAGTRPAWSGLPDPADLARVSFPPALSGYDPAAVDVHFEAVLRAYEDLWVAATPEVRERARLRAEARAGRPFAEPAQEEEFTAASVPEPPDLGESDAEALAAEAALARIEQDDDTGEMR